MNTEEQSFKVKPNFKAASKAYEFLVGFLTTLGNQIHLKYIPTFKVEVAISQFNYMLEAILISGALGEGEVNKTELQGIHKLLPDSHLLGGIRHKDGTPVSWNEITKLDYDTLFEMNENNKDSLKKTIYNFMTFIAVVEYLTKESVIEIITDHTCSIVSSIAGLDGRISDSEIKEASEALVLLFNNIHDEAKKDYFNKKNGK